MKKKVFMGILSLTSAILVAACDAEQSETEDSVSSSVSNVMLESSSASHENMDYMEHDESGEIPEGLQAAENPKYSIGEEVTILTGHMAGMEGATGTVVGAFETTAYEVTYEPTDGGELEKNHKWVVQEEITEAKDLEIPLEPGAEVTLEAKHIGGMEGATGTVDSAETTTVYMVDYQPTNGDREVKNHQWLVEDELSKE